MEVNITKEQAEAFFENLSNEVSRLIRNNRSKMMSELAEEIKKAPAGGDAKNAPKVEFVVKGKVCFHKELFAVPHIDVNRKIKLSESGNFVKCDSTPDMFEEGEASQGFKKVKGA